MEVAWDPFTWMISIASGTSPLCLSARIMTLRSAPILKTLVSSAHYQVHVHTCVHSYTYIYTNFVYIIMFTHNSCWVNEKH